jgi:hypothetical protein
LLIYNIFDTEDNTTPGYMTGTYLGKRKVLNVEAGIISQKNATWRKEAVDTLVQQHDTLVGSCLHGYAVECCERNCIIGISGLFDTNYGKWLPPL